jgi:phosphoribosylamine--glycine ligase
VQQGNATLTAGGRVLCATALGESIKAAQQRAYELVHGIHFDGALYRRDIGHRAVQPAATARGKR